MVYNKQLKREIPDGWEVKELSQIANIMMGQSPAGSSYNYEKSGTVFFQGSADFGHRYPTVRQYTTEPCRVAKQGDILLSVRAPVGAINLANQNCCIGRGLAALNSKDKVITFLFGVIKQYDSVFNQRDTRGTTFGSITKDDLYSLPVIYPINDILQNYEITIQPYFFKQASLYQQNQQLSSLRDWLLPMLMNGQVKVE